MWLKGGVVRKEREEWSRKVVIQNIALLSNEFLRIIALQPKNVAFPIHICWYVS